MRVLAAQSEPLLANQIKNLLLADGLSVDLALDGAEAQYRGETEPFDIIILDCDLPIKDGVSVFHALRHGGLATPVLMLTPHDQCPKFDVAPDAHLAKPLHMVELASQVRALLQGNPNHNDGVFSKNGLCFDRRARTVTVAGDSITLTTRETLILDYLFRNTGRLISKVELADYLYADDTDRPSNTIAVFVNRLRKKLGNDVIETVRGRGYVIKGAD